MRHDRFASRLKVRWGLLSLTALLAVGYSPAEAEDGSKPEARGLRPRRAWTDTGFEPEQSLGIFVGVRRFTKDDQLAEVPYAVDDAIDLAHVFALELGLLTPKRTRLFLSGEPQKQETRDRLRALIAAGAEVDPATRTDLIKAIDRQTRRAGPQGLLLISLATHGFSHEGVHYLMPEDSLIGEVQATGFPSSRLLEAVGQARTPRRIVFLDACRQRVVGARSGSDPRAAVPRQLSDAIAGARGEVILSAARLGGFAFDDEAQGNGVFTGAILDGLRCGASRDRRGFVTIETLTGYVDRRVTEWVEIHQGPDPGWPPGIESTLGGSVQNLPLVSCLEARDPDPPPPTLASTESELALWEEIKKSDDITELRVYLRRYPDGIFAEVAHQRIESLLPRPGEKWKDPGMGMIFRYIPSGNFPMGSPQKEKERESDEAIHNVELTRGFWMGETEVTQDQWRKLMRSNPSRFMKCGGDCPVEMVSWYDAVAFANRLSIEAGLASCYEREGCEGTPGEESYGCTVVELGSLDCEGYRLPTEAEWEYAVRAKSQTPFWMGHMITTEQANYNGKFPYVGGTKGVYRKKTVAVRSFASNPWGLYEVHGNVLEWTWDWYAEYPPGQATNPIGPSTGTARVLRGGSWTCEARHCRAANRSSQSPHKRWDTVGFRLVRTAR